LRQLNECDLQLAAKPVQANVIAFPVRKLLLSCRFELLLGLGQFVQRHVLSISTFQRPLFPFAPTAIPLDQRLIAMD
jgi:hypothetical protein